MKIQLTDRDGNDFLEPATIGQDGRVEFGTNDTGRSVEVGGHRLISETDFETVYLSQCEDKDNLLSFDVTSRRTLVEPGDSILLEVRFRFNSSNANSFPSPIAHSCSNCEYFLRLGQTKICNGLQTPSEDPNQPTECGHWQEIDREERSRRDRELRSQVRDDAELQRNRLEFESLRDRIDSLQHRDFLSGGALPELLRETNSKPQLINDQSISYEGVTTEITYPTPPRDFWDRSALLDLIYGWDVALIKRSSSPLL